MLVKILKVLPLRVSNFTDRNGQPAVFKTKPLVCQNESGTIYAEAIQDTAQKIEDAHVQEGMCAFISVTTVAREYKNSKEETRYANDINIQSLVLV